MLQAIVTVGLPGSGKTTFVKQLMEFVDVSQWEYFSGDDVRLELRGDVANQSNPGEIWAEVHRRVQAALAHGRNVVVDGVFTKRVDRKSLLSNCFSRTNDVEVICLRFVTPEETARAWNSSRQRVVPDGAITKNTANLVKFPPEKWEGFSEIIEVDPSRV